MFATYTSSKPASSYLLERSAWLAGSGPQTKASRVMLLGDELRRLLEVPR